MLNCLHNCLFKNKPGLGKKVILNLSEQFSVFFIWLSKFQEASRSGTELWIVLSQYFPHVSYFLVSFIISIMIRGIIIMPIFLGAENKVID